MGRNAGAFAAVTVILPVVPAVTGAGLPTIAPSTKKETFPVGVPPVTVALTVIMPFEATFVVDTVSCVVVATGPAGVLLPPPQPSAKLRMHINTNPRAALRRFLPGRRSTNIAARPVPQ